MQVSKDLIFRGKSCPIFVCSRSNAILGAAQRKAAVQESKSRWLFSSQFGTSEQQLLLLWHSFFFFLDMCICHAKEVAEFSGS